MIRTERTDTKRAIGTMRTTGLLIAALTAGVLLLCWPLPSKAQQVVEPQPPAENGPSARQVAATKVSVPISGYAIAPGDLLDVYVVGVPELSRTYRVDPFGQVTLPMLDHPISAEGLSPDEFADAIGGALRAQGVISHPDVLVSVQSSPSNSIAVTGSVVKPGIYPVFGQTTVMDVLMQAGGLAGDAGSMAIVTRGPKAMQSVEAVSTPNAGGTSPMPPRIVKIAIRHLLDTGNQAQDLTLYPGDTVNVPRAGIVYVVGAVNRAGGFALTGDQNQLTVLQAIALAGNLTRTAVPQHAMILRPSTSNLGGHKQITVKLKSILSGKAPDRTLIAGDILFVPDSTGKRVIGRVLSSIMTVAIYRVPY